MWRKGDGLWGAVGGVLEENKVDEEKKTGGTRICIAP